MKKLLLIFLPIVSFSQSTLIFSEYAEGSSFNKWVEIYNPTFMDISLDEYRYNFCFNGCDSLEWEYSLAFDSGYVLAPGDIYLITHYNADSSLLSIANQTTNLMSNGNDVLALLNYSVNTIVDIIGEMDSTEVSGWDVDGVVSATKDHTMIRKPDVCSGNIGDWSLSDGSSGASEWIVNVEDDFSNINFHNSNCNSSTLTDEIDSANRQLVEIKDLLSRNSRPINNRLLFYIYDDGTVEKRIVIE